MSQYPIGAFVVSGLFAGLAAWAELGKTYPRSPFRDRALTGLWLGIVGLDAAAGVAAVLVAHAVSLPQRAAWTGGFLGWVLIGLAAALFMRANLFTVTVGKTSVPLGFGVIYGTFRSLLEPRLRTKSWDIDYGEREGMREWAMDRADELNGSLTFDKAERIIRDYVSNVVLVNNPHDKKAKDNLEDAIRAAKKNLEDPEVGNIEGVKQLANFMINEGYTIPLRRLVGRPPTSLVRDWRRQNGPVARASHGTA